MSGLPRAVLDTDIIFSRVLHELFGRLAAEARLLDLLWSDELLDEARRVLVERKPLTPGVADRWVGYLREAFPAGRVDIGAVEPGVDPAQMTTDPNDAHVCALALAGRADVLLTFDRGYLCDVLHSHGVGGVARCVWTSADTHVRPAGAREARSIGVTTALLAHDPRFACHSTAWRISGLSKGLQPHHPGLALSYGLSLPTAAPAPARSRSRPPGPTPGPSPSGRGAVPAP